MNATISARFENSSRLAKIKVSLKNWLFLDSKEKILNAHECEIFIREVEELPLIREPNLSFYRGRKIVSEKKFPKSARDMGPPKNVNEIIGDRYNENGQIVLYCCDSIDGVKRELATREGTLFVQKYTIPLDTLKIVDLSQTSPELFISQVMLECERAGSKDCCDTVFSQSISALLMQHFDGFITFGVRGDAKFNYRNLIVFNPGDRWKKWILEADQPLIID